MKRNTYVCLNRKVHASMQEDGTRPTYWLVYRRFAFEWAKLLHVLIIMAFESTLRSKSYIVIIGILSLVHESHLRMIRDYFSCLMVMLRDFTDDSCLESDQSSLGYTKRVIRASTLYSRSEWLDEAKSWHRYAS